MVDLPHHPSPLGTNLISLVCNNIFRVWRPLFHLPSAVPHGRVLWSFATCLLCWEVIRKPLCWEYWSLHWNEIPYPTALSPGLLGGQENCFSPRRPTRFSLGLLISLLQHVRAGKYQAFKSISMAIFPLKLIFSLSGGKGKCDHSSLFSWCLKQTEMSRCYREYSEERNPFVVLGAVGRGHEGKHALLLFRSPTWSSIFLKTVPLPWASLWLQRERGGVRKWKYRCEWTAVQGKPQVTWRGDSCVLCLWFTGEIPLLGAEILSDSKAGKAEEGSIGLLSNQR